MTEALSPAQECLVHLSAALASRDASLLSGALASAHHTADPRAVEEALLQSYLFLGYPTALNAFADWRALTRRPAEPATLADGDWGERGSRVCQAVYGGQYEGLRDNVRRLHADMEQWMVEEGYGKVLGRPGLALADRELCIAAILAVLGVPRQLYSHLRGALNVGADETAVERALEIAASLSTDQARRSANETWAAVKRRSGSEDVPCS